MADHRPFEAPEALGLSVGDTARVLGGNAVDLFALSTSGGHP
jgi:hypothetical protein